MKKLLIGLLLMMSTQILAQSPTSTDNIKQYSVTDTTSDGREFYADLAYVQTLDKWMLRTDQVGMKIIREIHKKNKALYAENDTLRSINANLKIESAACEDQIVSKDLDISDKTAQIKLIEDQYKEEQSKTDGLQLTVKDLNKKVTAGKIMTIVGGVGIGVGLAGILYGVLK